ncbi:hypothetical protein FJZ31_21450 [Candidatus Poribacteria bacterium]|nr:hypothetical protein [Candidatus Poribacteria bacterium]
MAKAQKGKGCLPKLLTYSAIFLVLAVAFTVIAYRKVGGSEGFKRWLANQTLSAIEKQIIADKLYEVPKNELKNTFKQVKNANSQGKTDLKKLYQFLSTYQRRFKERKPSVDDVNEFLGQLRSTVISNE